MSDSKLIRGTMILTMGVMISKILGLIYVFPFYALVGPIGGALYQYTYVLYSIFISLSTMGIPLAVSKFISKYNALGEYKVGRRLFKSGMFVMGTTGVLAFITLYITAPFIAPLVIVDADQAISVEQLTTVVRAVSFALIPLPIMSLIRGFFQGHESMGPTAASQVVEQIIRIAFLLTGTFIVLRVMNGDLTTAISLATFAAFVGTLGGLAVLLVYLYKRKDYLNQQLEEDKGTYNPSLKQIYKELILYAIPFVVVGLSGMLYQLIDQLTFNRAMVAIGLAEVTDSLFTMLNFTSQKLVLIPVSLATALGLTLIPTITTAYVGENYVQLKKYLHQTFQIVFFLTFPAAIGLSVLAGPAYTFFYEKSLQGSAILQAYAPLAILFAMFSVTSAIMQGINHQRLTILSMLAGLFVKLILNYWFITMFAVYGAIAATALGYTTSIVIQLYFIKKYTGYSYSFVARRILLMIIFTIMMAIAVKISTYFVGLVISYEAGRWHALIVTLVGVTVGGALYGYLSYTSGLLQYVLGNRIPFLSRRKQQAEG
ncbi:polysaccharide biosynthesis protein [Bacillus sp. HMF5848]|uniref:putative polysaccharide biosynthesis protein n=1 Tax=Bacillus sp. HMF5848 TaxID=2495421 RepID=UPI000F7B5277|nr:polysaccharide biosynthesis protein [Bacillus sp. HMF5848]RSK28231.1 polysaccharide biosynthesis protein [Bacillus sp. HMF5848]